MEQPIALDLLVHVAIALILGGPIEFFRRSSSAEKCTLLHMKNGWRF